MKTCKVFLLALALSVAGNGAFALSITGGELASLSWTFAPDPINDEAGPGQFFKTFGMGHAVSGGFLYVAVQTNFPQLGALGRDSYTNATHFSPGDLYLNVGGTFQGGGGTAYGIGTTNHANVVTQAYAGQVWQSIQAGRLYTSPVFATGTFEQYQIHHLDYSPDDGDGNNRVNSYPTLMMQGTLVNSDVSGILYRSSQNTPWAYEIVYKVALSALGLTGAATDPTLQAFWVMECGNDGVQDFVDGDKAVPEPGTWVLLLAGVSALAARRKNRL
jgi:hypothetical protein